MLTRILADDGAADAASPSRITPRRLALAGAMTAVVAAVALAGTVTTPWSHGQKAASAWAIQAQPGGAIDVTITFAELRDPTALNRALQQQDARTVVMQRSAPGACTTPVPGDPAHQPVLRVSGGQDLYQAMREQWPWLTLARGSDADPGVSLYTIHPALIPAGDQILIMYSWESTQASDGTPGGAALSTTWMLVPSLPPCVPATQDQVHDANGIRVH